MDVEMVEVPAWLRAADGRSLGRVSGSAQALQHARSAAVRLLAAFLCAALALLIASAGAGAQPLTSNPLFERYEELTSAGALSDARLGRAVAMSADGVTALLGGPGEETSAGAAWTFGGPGLPITQQAVELTGGEQGETDEEVSCEEEGEEEGNACRFGRSVALSADGNTAVVGAPVANDGRGAVWVFTRTASGWSTQGTSLSPGAEEKNRGHFGRSVALSADGNTVLVGAPLAKGEHGAVWVFSRNGGTWTQTEAIGIGSEEVGSGHFGRAVALSANGDVALVGAPSANGQLGQAWLLSRSGSGSGWSVEQQLPAGAEESGAGRFGTSVALSGDGQTAMIGAPNDSSSGAVWSFTSQAGGFAQQGPKLTSSEGKGSSNFGESIALSYGGATALIGGPRDKFHLGAVWAFTTSGAGWSQQGAKIVDEAGSGASLQFGASVALSANGRDALIGEPGENGGSGATWALSGPAPAPPTVTSVSPNSGPSTGGTSIRVKGTGFLPGATVEMGSLAATAVIDSEDEISAQTSAAPPGSYEVVVTDANGVSSNGPSFTYTAPASEEKQAEEKHETTGAGSGGSGGSSSGGTGASTSAGTSLGAHSGVLASSTGVPAPKLGVSANLTLLSGAVSTETPRSHTFTRLTGTRQVPIGTIVDTRHGRVRVTTANTRNQLQNTTFYAGEFKLTQNHAGVVLASLVGGSFSACPTARERAHLASAAGVHVAANHLVRELWATGNGSYSTKGNYASGAAQSTTWLTEDLCEGTLIRVTSKRVVVSDLVKHIHKTVSGGHSYLAHAPH
jgi:IPT/TIG domain/FG-GAP repeat